MKRLIVPVSLCLCFLFSGCTVAQFAYMRNLTQKSVDIFFDFDASALAKIPDSIYVPFSATSHPINKNTPKFMTDSIVARRYTGTTLRIIIPDGGMIMFDKNTSQKIGYHDPQKVKVAVPGKEPYTVRLYGTVQSGEAQFQKKGNSPKIYWHDIY